MELGVFTLANEAAPPSVDETERRRPNVNDCPPRGDSNESPPPGVLPLPLPPAAVWVLIRRLGLER